MLVVCCGDGEALNTIKFMHFRLKFGKDPDSTAPSATVAKRPLKTRMTFTSLVLMDWARSSYIIVHDRKALTCKTGRAGLAAVSVSRPSPRPVMRIAFKQRPVCSTSGQMDCAYLEFVFHTICTRLSTVWMVYIDFRVFCFVRRMYTQCLASKRASTTYEIS